MSIGALLVVIGLIALAFAFLFGGREERIFAAAQAISAISEHSFLAFGENIIGAVIIDLAVLAVVVPLAMRSNKVWPLIGASFCVATLMTEGAQVLVRGTPEAYAIIQGSWDLLASLVVAAAAWQLRRTRRTLRAASSQ